MRAISGIACIAFVVTGCRFGFDELSGSENGDDDIIVTPPVPGVASVIVTGEDGEPNAGQPIANAYVVAIESDGTTTTKRTDASGEAAIEILGNTEIHVAQPVTGGHWALSSFRAINDGASITVGGRPPQATSMARMLTINLPAFPMDYDQAWITGPRRCLADTAWEMSTSVVLKYDPQCEGETVELYALAWDIYVPLGATTLVDGATIDRTGSTWADMDKVGIGYINVPADVTDTYALVAFPTGTGDLIPMSENGDEVDLDRSVGLGFDIPPAVPGMSVIHAFLSPAGVRVKYEQIDQWPGMFEVDASMIPPAPPSPSIVPGFSQIQWTAGAAADADVYWSAIDITTNGSIVRWNAFGPPSATQVKFPVLPSELASLVPTGASAWGTPRIVLAALSDYDYVSVLEIVDRDIFWWWSQGVHMPTGDVSITSTQLPP